MSRNSERAWNVNLEIYACIIHSRGVRRLWGLTWCLQRAPVHMVEEIVCSHLKIHLFQLRFKNHSIKQLLVDTNSESATHVGHVDVVKMTCWISTEASNWGRKRHQRLVSVVDVCWSEYFHKQLTCWDFQDITTVSGIYKERCQKKRKYPARGSNTEGKIPPYNCWCQRSEFRMDRLVEFKPSGRRSDMFSPGVFIQNLLCDLSSIELNCPVNLSILLTPFSMSASLRPAVSLVAWPVRCSEDRQPLLSGASWE